MSTMALEILYEDAQLVVVVKPGGLLAVPGRGPDKFDSLATRLQTAFPAMIAQPAVHRLDMYTSGLMVFAVSSTAHRRLSMDFAAGRVDKGYAALVEGEIEEEAGEIRLPFRLDPDHRPLQIYDPLHGKIGISRWRRLAGEGCLTRIAFTPLTGRTHQLRLHAAHPLGLAAPIRGDSLYGIGHEGETMCLHADKLAFHHPASGRRLEFRSPPAF